MSYSMNISNDLQKLKNQRGIARETDRFGAKLRVTQDASSLIFQLLYA